MTKRFGAGLTLGVLALTVFVTALPGLSADDYFESDRRS
jgi:hypothetical protein